MNKSIGAQTHTHTQIHHIGLQFLKSVIRTESLERAKFKVNSKQRIDFVKRRVRKWGFLTENARNPTKFLNGFKRVASPERLPLDQYQIRFCLLLFFFVEFKSFKTTKFR